MAQGVWTEVGFVQVAEMIWLRRSMLQVIVTDLKASTDRCNLILLHCHVELAADNGTVHRVNETVEHGFLSNHLVLLGSLVDVARVDGRISDLRILMQELGNFACFVEPTAELSGPDLGV